MEGIITKIQELFALFGLKIIVTILIIVIGQWVAKLVRNVLEKVLRSSSKVDNTLVDFLGNLTYVILLIFIIVAALGHLGVQTASLVALIGAAGLAVGLALQGSLANLAAGILLIVFRPFKVEDLIEAAGVTGVVEKIEIFTTQLKTMDNKTIIIPNAKLTGDNIINFTKKEIRRVDLVIGVSYDDNIDKVKEVIAEVLNADDRVLDDPPHKVAVYEMADNSVNFVVRPWVKTGDYWDVYFSVMENIKKRFDEESITIPFPQRDVHLYNENSK
ncbi:mechanosensitive ion channel family protein [Thermodesulfobacteriota bacterium]